MFCPICHHLGGRVSTYPRNDTEQYSNEGSGSASYIKLVHCSGCNSAFKSDLASIDRDTDMEAQALVNFAFYLPQFDDSEFKERISQNEQILRVFERFWRQRQTYVEVGTGIGFLTRAAGNYFAHAIGLDLEVSSAIGLGQISETVRFERHDTFVREGLADLDIDVLAAWHVLEHLPDPHAILGRFLERIVPEGVFMGQVPMLRAKYVIDAHHIFYKAETLVSLLKPYDMYPIYLEMDETNDFLSFCFRKS